jgi:hypothetical protein
LLKKGNSHGNNEKIEINAYNEKINTYNSLADILRRLEEEYKINIVKVMLKNKFSIKNRNKNRENFTLITPISVILKFFLWILFDRLLF